MISHEERERTQDVKDGVPRIATSNSEFQKSKRWGQKDRRRIARNFAEGIRPFQFAERFRHRYLIAFMKAVNVMIPLFGLVLLIAGLMELKLRLRSSDTPTRYSIADLERGGSVSNLLATIDSHHCLYDEIVYSYQTYDQGKLPTGNEYVDKIWYPIVSDEQFAANGARSTFRVIVNEKMGMVRLRDLPTGVQHRTNLSGMFLDGFHSLGGEERRLLQSGFPNINFDHVLLFEVDRKPSSAGEIIGLIVGGLLTIALAGVWWLGYLRKRGSNQNQPPVNHGRQRPGSEPAQPGWP